MCAPPDTLAMPPNGPTRHEVLATLVGFGLGVAVSFTAILITLIGLH